MNPERNSKRKDAKLRSLDVYFVAGSARFRIGHFLTLRRPFFFP